MRVVVTGLIASYPTGGVVWDYGQYLLGLQALGCDVVYLEDPGHESYDSLGRSFSDAPDGAVAYLAASLRALDATLADRWHLRTPDGRRFGMPVSALERHLSQAELFLNVSGGALLREEYAQVARTVLVDTDPGFNHFVIWPSSDARDRAPGVCSWREHTRHMTYAELLGLEGCTLPDMGLSWQPTRPPVCLDRWQPAPSADRWTTIMSWGTYDLAPPLVDSTGRRYGAKEPEFHHIAGLPGAVPESSFEIATRSWAPVAEWTAAGWSWADAEQVTADPRAYRDYVQRSRAEVSVAKQAYVATRSGWSSCRSACYLAAGRPVVLQDTGWSQVLPAGTGLLTFDDAEGAVAAVRDVETDLAGHGEAARALAETHFAAERVLEDLLGKVGL